ncbi:MAG: hypothetical protein ACLTYN_01625 [Dysosmobacter welbionis]
MPLLHVGGSASALKDDPATPQRCWRPRWRAAVMRAVSGSGGALFAQKKDFTALAEALRAELGEDRLLY